MMKNYVKGMFLGALTFVFAAAFVSCSDYDDDIKNLQEQMDKKASLEDLNSKVTTLESSIQTAKTEAANAKTAADAAKTKAEEALTAAGQAGGVSEAELEALQKALEDAEKDLNDQISKLASLEAVDAKIAALKKELQDGSISADQLKALAADVDALSAKVMSLIGHRLTSLAVIPTTHVNGIAAIKLTTLQYTPQVYRALTTHDTQDHTGRALPVLDHVAVTGASTRTISTSNNEAYFHVSPSLGVRTEDIQLPTFECITSENELTRAATITSNSPVKPVSYAINKNVLTVKFEKTITGSVAAKGGHSTGKETFYMASLKAPIAPANYNADEKAAFDKDGTKVYVNSEYVRLHEAIQIPYLVNSLTDFKKTIAGEFADETQIGSLTSPRTDDAGKFYVHYHDSVCMYESKANEYVDVKWDYSKELDLKTLVKVCVTDAAATTHNNAHEDLTNYADYGLAFRFYLPSKAYNTLGGQDGNTNKTDQQKFAKIDSKENGIMTSKVYTIDGGSATAVGREPIVRVELIDTKNNNALIAVRYLKVKWVRDTEEKDLSCAFNDTIYYCANYNGRIGTEKMNVDIYDKAKTGGMTKQEFHSVYTLFDGTSGKGEGTAIELINTESGVESYNVLWTLTHADIVTKYPTWNKQEKMDFSKVVYYKDPSGSYPTLKITLTRTIYKPVFNLWGYDGRYWKNEAGNQWQIFNVNPIVYNTQEANPAWSNNTMNNPTSNIYTDLLNGYLDDYGVKPTTGAGGAIYYTDKNRAAPGYKGKFYYSAFYPKAVAGSLADKAGTYEEEGVRFVFDKDKIANYKYPYFDGTTVKETAATISADGTILYIAGVKAAEILNFVPNTLDPNEMTYNIRLEEANPTHAPRTGDAPTEAAKAIVGKYVPIKLIANICADSHPAAWDVAHTVTIKEYEAFIIEPLTVKPGTTDNFTDATIGGSTISVKGAFSYLSWNADDKGNKYVVSNSAGATALQRALWEFYEVTPGEWMTDQIKSNLKLVDGNLIPTAGVTNGPLPSNTTVVYNGANETLTYNNYSGTPVNWDYKLFIPVKFGYKWRTLTQMFEIDVKKNAGTPAE